MSADEARVVDLGEASLMAEARARTGLEDFGEPWFLEGLRRLLAMYEGEANLTPAGRKTVRRRLLELLENRLRIEEAFARHPEIRARIIAKPVFLTGLPRTGTSAFFNLLGADPASRPLLFWEGKFPSPLEGLAPGTRDPRLVALDRALEEGHRRNPEFAKIHYTRAEGPEECVQLLAHTLSSVQMGIEPLMSPYREWFESQDQRRIYAYYADLLRMLDFQRPGERWLLKSPCHLWAIDVLLELFPDAGIVFTHRDPTRTLPSYCSMMEALMRPLRASFDPTALGPVVLEYLARSLERGLAARDAADPKRFVDVRYAQFVSDPVGAARRVYEAFDLPLTAAVEEALVAHATAHPQNRHGAHRYGLEQFGLTADAVRERLAFYLERFDLREPS